MERLSRHSARRIALAAQGFGAARPAAPDRRPALTRVLRRTQLLQMDPVSVLARAHYLPLFSRLGPYSTALLDEAAWGRRPALFEYWAHEASLLPYDLHPALRWRMARAERGEGVYGGLKPFARERRSEAEALLRRIEQEGPLAASDLAGQKGRGGWWGWSAGKQALEWLFWAGRLTTRTRRGFERVYDLPERVLPAAVLHTPTPSEADAHRLLIARAARALGVATAGDLRDYFRLGPADAAPAVAALVEAGELTPVAVEGWDQAAFLHRDARAPRRVQAQALLAPFDHLVWFRPRAERVFGLRYRLEIYTPAHKREHGYYVLPFLLGDRIVARADLKRDKAANVLRVQAVHAEPDAPGRTAEALAQTLGAMAAWLGVDGVAVEPKGDLAPALAAAAGA
jgi:uncharacterized protein YcaQ